MLQVYRCVYDWVVGVAAAVPNKPDKPKTFRATLEQLRDGLGWTVVRIPFIPADAWKTMIRLRVRGVINGFAFRNSLFPYTTGGYFLLVNKTMQQGAEVRLGALAEFTIEPDLEHVRRNYQRNSPPC